MAHKVKDPNELEEEEVSVFASGEKNVEKRAALEIAEAAREKEYRNPSFGSKLFMGVFDPSLLFPFPEQSKEDQQIGDEFIAKLEPFLREHLDPDEVDRTCSIPQEVIDGLAKMGLFAIKIPKEYNGLGFSQTNYNRVVMKVASYCGATAVLLSAHQSIGVPQPLLMYGTEEQKKKFFPRFREGAISAFALTEEDVGSDPAKMSSVAELSEDGSHYILNGTKLWCTNGTIADIIVVMAQTAPKIVRGKEKKQISAFILEMNTPGVEVIHRCEFMGLHGIYNGMIKFENVKIPKENLIWKEGRGLAMALGTINVGRLTLPAASAGSAKQCLSIARRWGNERVQWGMPVGKHEAGREKLAYIASTTMAIEAITWLTSKWADEKKVDIRIEAAMAKYFCTEQMWKITDITMQLRGGRGYETARSLAGRGEDPFPVERAMRDCRINMILEGTSEIMKLFLAREAMDPHLRKAADLLSRNTSVLKKVAIGGKLLLHYLFWYPKQWVQSLFGSAHVDLGPLTQQYRYIDKKSHKLAYKLLYYMGRYQQGLEQKQMILGRLMDVGTDLFAMAATCSYAHSKFTENPGDSSPIDLANHFCALAKRRIDNSFEALGSNDDSSANAVADRVLEGDCRWLEEGIIWIGKEV
ncbi:MAG: acyl-CoA dehydrogenase family protein [Chlamydiota bacterium]|nr:acyl-CoA dehydrogenase family protein [Chlamydiota bacterium]